MRCVLALTAAAAATYALSTPEHGTGVVERTDTPVTYGDIVGAFCAVDPESCEVEEVDRGITWRLVALDVDSDCRAGYLSIRRRWPADMQRRPRGPV